MNFTWEDKSVSRRFLGCINIGLRAMISALVRWPVRIWFVGTIVIAIVVAGFLVLPQTPTLKAAPEPNPPQDCISCHPKALEFHDKLGSGNKACWVCHDSTDMKMLRLADGTPLSLPDSAQLCGQCHQKRYESWIEGTHGVPSWTEGGPAISGAENTKCTGCHDPHQPQIALLGITKAHPPAQPPPAPPSTELLVMLGISLLLVIAVGIAVVAKGEGS